MMSESTKAVIKTAYLGPSASFSHAAALEALPSTQAVPLSSFNAIFAALQHQKDEYAFAVLPVENSTNGAVVQVLDLLARCGLDLHEIDDGYPDVEVVGEWYLQVHHCLFVTKAAMDRIGSTAHDGESEGEVISPGLLEKLDIKTLYSHPQVWGQCGNFLGKYFPPAMVDRVDVSSTSAAAAFIAKHDGNIDSRETDSGTMAAISSQLAGQQHNHFCLAANIEDNPGQNTTRFLILRNRKSKIPLPPLGNDTTPAELVGLRADNVTKAKFFKSLVTFTIPHTTPGSLATALEVFSKHNLNLTAIQSRPSSVTNWHYVFFVECQHSVEQANLPQEEGTQSERSQKGLERIQTIIKELTKLTERVKWLGTWKDMLVED